MKDLTTNRVIPDTYVVHCSNCQSQSFCWMDAFQVCTECGLELQWSNVQDEISEFEHIQNYDHKSSYRGYDRMIYFKRILRCLEGNQETYIPSDLYFQAKEHFTKQKTINEVELRKFLKFKKAPKMYCNVWVYIKEFTSYKNIFPGDSKKHALDVFREIENNFNDMTEYNPNKKKFFPYLYLISEIFKYIDTHFQVNYDPNEIVQIFSPPSAHIRKKYGQLMQHHLEVVHWFHLGFIKK